jgi:hypothetical protein
VLDIIDPEVQVARNQKLAPFKTYQDSHCFKPVHKRGAAAGRSIAVTPQPVKTPGGVEMGQILFGIRPFLHRLRRVLTV